ncbi:hypothetical protein [Nostoc sp.]|uniref:hypothetical protein n=1 Tax=Nostoc sp. TaxID=1180 RepID=UPI002FF65DB0
MTHQSIVNPDTKFVIAGDIYKVQRRPMHSHIVINNNYQGIRVVDPWNGNDLLQVDFTEGYSNSGIINEWCFRADGQAVLILNEEHRTASLLSLESNLPSYSLLCPSVQRVIDLRYIWEKNLFWITGGKSYAFFHLEWQGDIPIFVERSGMQARIAHRSWRRALDKLPVSNCNVLRVEADKSQMLYHDFSEKSGQVGVVSWQDEISWSAPAPEEVSRLAFDGKQMFILHEYEVHALNEQGQIETVYPVPEGFHYSGLDTIPAQDNKPAALVLVCNSLSDPHYNQFLVYQLDSSKN